MKRVWIKVERICVSSLCKKNGMMCLLLRIVIYVEKAKLRSWKEVVKRWLLMRC